MRETGGSCASVTDDQVIDAIGLLARTEDLRRDGGGVTIASLAKLVAAGAIRRRVRRGHGHGHGLKTWRLLADHIGPTATIAPTLAAFDAALDTH